jgi:hypothetical protein
MRRQRDVGAVIYFFDAYDGDALYADTEGTNCATAANMRLEATRILMELASDNFSDEDRLRTLTVVARSAGNEQGGRMTLTFSRE